MRNLRVVTYLLSNAVTFPVSKGGKLYLILPILQLYTSHLYYIISASIKQ
jgi:hypothetical protein